LGVQTPSLPIFISVSRLAATLVARVGGGINGWLPFKIYIYIYKEKFAYSRRECGFNGWQS
jgi:hypothetical protein